MTKNYSCDKIIIISPYFKFFKVSGSQIVDICFRPHLFLRYIADHSKHFYLIYWFE